eukprot:Blabericola_migrator_1__5029@NODE_2609_length_2542_cov_37_432727_g1637_i0_p2_GENE_NODE_2609_length_2542_cov_37_432727_g1637_i0NODE_2609_length_2542_cov_37_432727_g1637_i0_p2_ORF_typecomplete_len123_score2_28_NODE_2609_length_2542_cov_37_432727_g1637_i021002468
MATHLDESPIWFAGFMAPSAGGIPVLKSPPPLGPSRRPVSSIGTLKPQGISPREVLLSSVHASQSYAWLKDNLAEEYRTWRLFILPSGHEGEWDSLLARTRFLETVGEGKHAACLVVRQRNP